MLKHLDVFVIGAALLSSPISALAIGPGSNGLFRLDPAAGRPYSNARTVSADGRVVGGTSGDSSASLATLWNLPSLQPTVVAQSPISNFDRVTALSSNGGRVLGTRSTGPYRLTLPGTIENLVPPAGFSQPSASAMSADGSVMVGLAFPNSQGQAIRWSSPQAAQSLGVLSGATNSAATGVSANGALVVGYSGGSSDRAFLWSSAGMQSLGVLPGDASSRADSISGDGQVVVGFSSNFGFNRITGFRWTAGSGMQPLGWLPDGTISEGVAASYDGSIIVGSATTSGSMSRAVLWLPGDTSPRDLNTYLPTLGIDTTGWSLGYVTGVSADGHVLVGGGTYNDQPRAFVAVIPTPASALLLLLCCAVSRRRR